MADIAGPQESPTGKPDNLGRFKTEQARSRALGNLKPPRRPGDPPLNPNNLGGRPKKDGPATRELRRLLLKQFPNDAQGRTYLKLVIEGLVKQAIKGNVFAQQLIFERLEGRLPLPVEADLPCQISVIVNRNMERLDCEQLKERHLLPETSAPVAEREES